MRLLHFLRIAFIFLFLTLIGSCDKDSSEFDREAPDNVHGVKIQHGDQKVNISWEDPASFDFKNVVIYWLDQSAEVENGVEAYEITGLENDKRYEILIRSVDYDGNQSPGIKLTGFPRGMAVPLWEDEQEIEMGYSTHGYPNGYFELKRNFSNIGNTGYITIQIQFLDKNKDLVLSDTQKTFLVEGQNDYRLYFKGKGDITLFNCTDCDPDSANIRVSFVINPGGENFLIEPICCDVIPPCLNGNNKRSIRWNNAWMKTIFLQKLE